MALQTHEEIRKDEQSGKFYIWEVTTSDVPGEGGQRRLDEITLTGLTRHELAVREMLDRNAQERVGLEAKLVKALEYKGQMEALTPGTAAGGT